ncbi:hypothetical protein H0H87_012917 [Tephrocybe sp. NHM501043]|nr:hypothetical protein H0H87_012917 [Tephrocybe sp. NHM501043]
MVEVICTQIDPDPELTWLIKQHEKQEAQNLLIKVEDGETTLKQCILCQLGKGKVWAIKSKAEQEEEYQKDQEFEDLMGGNVKPEAQNMDVVMKDPIQVPVIIGLSDLEAYGA